MKVLEKENLIKRSPSPTDRRLILVRPTDKGKKIINENPFPGITLLNQAADLLGQEKSDQLLALLDEYHQNILNLSEDNKKGDVHDQA